VTTLIVSIGLIRRHVLAAPALDRRPARDTRKAEQPFPVVRPPPRHDERTRDHLPLIVHDEQARLRQKNGARVRDDGDDGDFALLAVRLPQLAD
jgi:hypothetical protein